MPLPSRRLATNVQRQPPATRHRSRPPTGPPRPLLSLPYLPSAAVRCVDGTRVGHMMYVLAGESHHTSFLSTSISLADAKGKSQVRGLQTGQVISPWTSRSCPNDNPQPTCPYPPTRGRHESTVGSSPGYALPAFVVYPMLKYSHYI